MPVSITGTSGSIAHSSSVTISGSGFGTKTTAAPNLWDTVDNQLTYSSLADGDAITVGGSNPWNENASGDDNVKLESSDASRHSLDSEFYRGTNSVNWSGTLENRSWTNTNIIYVSWWSRAPSTISEGAAKYLRVSNSGGQVNSTFTWAQQAAYCFNNPNFGPDGTNFATFDLGNPANTWRFLETWIDAGTQRFTCRVDGSAVHNNIDWSNIATFPVNQVWKIGFDGNGPNNIDFDDIYLDTTYSRVMIGNASTYATCTSFEMQPPTSWADDSVAVTINRGNFGASATAYLYVFDSANAVNANGFEITFGGGGAAVAVKSERIVSFGGSRRRVLFR